MVIDGGLLLTAVIAGGGILVSWGIAKKTVSNTEEKVKQHDEVLPEIGKLQIQITTLDSRVAEDRKLNADQHDKFLETKYQADATAKEMSEVKTDVKAIMQTTQTILIEVGKLTERSDKDVSKAN